MLTNDQRSAKIEAIRRFPDELANIVSGLSKTQLTTPYLAEEWSAQRIVHHTADSHMNGLIRLKLVLTAEEPPLVAYDQDEWSTLPDVELPIEVSLGILRGVHQRWCAIWDSLQEADWTRTGIHTENGRISTEDLLNIYDNHCRAHLDQLKRVLAAANTAPTT
ncbi:MAG: DinB family protein [Anaerolineae bacterium]|nr:DinB family protein [Anaerolineae bacterium]